MSDTVITVKGLNKSFIESGHKTPVLKGIDFTVRRGELLCLIGPSGCGKSTLLRILAGLDKNYQGEIRSQPNLKIGMVFQNFGLFSWLTVKQNIAFGLKMRGMKESEIDKRVDSEMSTVGLSGHGSNHPKELSGGMKQRVGLARALVAEPDILFMDEPFSALDAFTAKNLRQDLLDIWAKRKMTVVMVTHLVEEAAELADSIIVLSKRPGEVKEVVNNPLSRPRDRRSQPFYDLADNLERLVTT